MRILYTTDVHGNKPAYSRLFEVATKEDVDAVIIGGDVSPNKVAVVLKGGEILPIDTLESVGPADSYRASIESWFGSQRSRSTKEPGVELSDHGYMLWNTDFSLYDLLFEQKMLEKLADFFGGSGDVQFKLDEIDFIEQHIVPIFAAEEDTWSASERARLTDRYAKALTIEKATFEMIRPSKHLGPCLRMRLPDSTRLFASLPKSDRELWYRAISYQSVIEQTVIRKIARRSVASVLHEMRFNYALIGELQGEFLRDYLLPLIEEWRLGNSQKPVFVLLGNDDVSETASLLENSTVCSYLNGKVYNNTLPGISIGGYGFVEALPIKVQYTAWVKCPEEILRDLKQMTQTTSSEIIWVIHAPAYGHLDEVKPGIHLGSEAVRQFLTDTQPEWALFGHIHEGASVAGSVITTLGKTICVNPGGDHERKVSAVVINTKTHSVASAGE